MHAHGNAPVARVERRVRKQKFAVGAAFDSLYAIRGKARALQHAPDPKVSNNF